MSVIANGVDLLSLPPPFHSTLSSHLRRVLGRSLTLSSHDMAPRKPHTSSSSKSAPLPPPNSTHPAHAFIPSALAPGHPHSASYHSFITSPYLPSTSDSQPPKKRARTERALPELLDAPLEAKELHKKLLGWFDGVKGAREMPWRKEVFPSELSKRERSQRGYEVRSPLL